MKQYRNEIFSFLMLMAGVLLEYAQTSWFALPYVSLVWFLAAVRLAFLSWRKHGSI